jgi:hypothetical protein
MNGNPFEIIDTPWGTMEAWRASTMAIGTMGALSQVYKIVRNDAAELEKKTVAFDAKKASVLRTVNKLLNFMSRVDALTSRVEALEARHRADEEERERLEEEPISLPPDLAARQASSPASKIDDDEDETHHPSGDLHSVAPKEEPSEDEPSELPEPPLEDSDNVGDLPEELQLGEPSGPPEPKGHIYSQPTAISLNEA